MPRFRPRPRPRFRQLTVFTAGLTACLALLLVLTGCTGYVLRGRVIEGPMGVIRVVDEDDPRLKPAPDGVANATVSVVENPRWLNRRPLGDDITDADGRFAVPIDAAGAGFLEIQAGIQARSSDHHEAKTEMLLPGGDKRLLIVLPRTNRATPEDPHETYLDETIKMRDEYIKRLR